MTTFGKPNPRPGMGVGRATLYRIFAADGRLLYVGIAKNVDKRLGQHAMAKEWWTDSAVIAVEHFDNRSDAADAEERAIWRERPIHNVHFSSTPGPTSHPARIGSPVMAALAREVRALAGGTAQRRRRI